MQYELIHQQSLLLNTCELGTKPYQSHQVWMPKSSQKIHLVQPLTMPLDPCPLPPHHIQSIQTPLHASRQAMVAISQVCSQNPWKTFVPARADSRNPWNDFCPARADGRNPWMNFVQLEQMTETPRMIFVQLEQTAKLESLGDERVQGLQLWRWVPWSINAHFALKHLVSRKKGKKWQTWEESKNLQGTSAQTFDSNLLVSTRRTIL